MDRVTTEEVHEDRTERRGQSGAILRGRRRFNVSSSDRARTYAFKRIPSSKRRGEKATSRGNDTENDQRSANNTGVPNAGPEASGAGGVHAPAYGGGPASCIGFVESRRERLQLIDEGSAGHTGIPVGMGAPSCTIDLRGNARRSFSSRLTKDKASIPSGTQRPGFVGTINRDCRTRKQIQEGGGESETGLSLSSSTAAGRLKRFAVIGPEDGAAKQMPTTCGAGHYISRRNPMQVAGNEPVLRRRVCRRRPKTPGAGGRRHRQQSAALEFNELQSLLDASRRILSGTTTLWLSKDIDVDVSSTTAGQNSVADPGTRHLTHQGPPIAKINDSLHRQTPPADYSVVGPGEGPGQSAEDGPRTADSDGPVKRNGSASRNAEGSANVPGEGITVHQGRPKMHQLGTLKTEQSSRTAFPHGTGGRIVAQTQRVRGGQANPNHAPNLRNVAKSNSSICQGSGAEISHAECTTNSNGNNAVIDSGQPHASIAKSGDNCEAASATAPVEAPEASFLEGEAAAYSLTGCHDGVVCRSEDRGIQEDKVGNGANNVKQERAGLISTTAATATLAATTTATASNSGHDMPGIDDPWAPWHSQSQHNKGGNEVPGETGAMVVYEGGTQRTQVHSEEQQPERRCDEAGSSWYRAVPEALDQGVDTNEKAMADGGWRYDEQSESWQFDESAGEAPECCVAQQPEQFDETSIPPATVEQLRQEDAPPPPSENEEVYTSTNEATARNRGTSATSRVADGRRQRGLRIKRSRLRANTRDGETSRAVLFGNDELANMASPKVSERRKIGDCRCRTQVLERLILLLRSCYDITAGSVKAST